jgi:serine/threonine protein kinase, bacterial
MTIKLLNDRYQVIRTLGAGGFGETFLAEDTYMPSKRRCVVKLLRPIQNNPTIYQLVQDRFQREAAILEELGGASDQIPTLYAYFEASSQFYLVQEFVEGDTLSCKVLQQGLFAEAGVLELLVNLLPVLEFVHSKQIVHRDIKPDNIILRHRDGQPVLIDFGAVRESMGTVVSSQNSPTSSIVIGTPGYMPSEQAMGRPVYASDLYSLGMTAIYLLTGRQPQQFETDSQTGDILWRQHVNHVSPKMVEVLERAIAYHPRERFTTARAMLEALQSIASPFPATQAAFTQPPSHTPAQSPETVSITTKPTTQGNRNNGSLMGALIAGGLIGASVIISFVLSKSPETIVKRPVSPTAAPIAPVLDTSIPPVGTTTANDYSFLSERLVSDADLRSKDGFELDIMRNYIFARYGRRFDTPGLQEYFNKQPWYRPQYSPKKFPTQLVSATERRNIEYINMYQERNNLRYFKK